MANLTPAERAKIYKERAAAAGLGRPAAAAPDGGAAPAPTPPPAPPPAAERPAPAYSVLDSSKYTQVTGRKMRDWREALVAYHQALDASP